MRFISELKHPFKRQNSRLDAVHSEPQFCEILEKERLRTHRSGIPFSILIFDDVNSDRNPLYEKLIVFLKERLRSTDEIGWYTGSRLAVLLPDTRCPGAEVLANDIARKMKPDILSIRVQVYPGIDTSADRRSEGRHIRAIKPPAAAFSGNEAPLKAAQCNIHLDAADCSFVASDPGWKRMLDIAGSSVGLILLFPLFLIIAAYIKIVSPGPVLFKQERLGFRRKPFTIYKFRTMRVCAETECHMEYSKAFIKNSAVAMTKLDEKDPRLIPFARILRSTGLDELPQLFNILKGDMSIVGPRPCMDYEAEEYTAWQHERFDSKPGLTGLWQVSGKNRTTFLEMARFDARYAKRRTFLRDVFIIFMTVPAVFIQILDMPKKDKK
ncbi:sugar transferase [Desulfococcus sp.]|uniref:sugar transferase n=1 Tax=Desulfococcus sp. TaxID=2025834 RepID=UPI0035932AD4